jgi:hypothetical protein
MQREPYPTSRYIACFAGAIALPGGSILLSTHYDPLSSRPTARRVLERIFPECPASPESQKSSLPDRNPLRNNTIIAKTT